MYNFAPLSSTQNPCLGLCFRTLGVRVGVFQLGWTFTSPTLSSTLPAWDAPQSPRIGRGDNTDQLSFRSSSVLTALRAPNVRFPTLCAAHCCCRCCCFYGACLPALPTALSPPTSSCQIVDAICIYPFSLLRRICWGSHFFQRSG